MVVRTLKTRDGSAQTKCAPLQRWKSTTQDKKLADPENLSAHKSSIHCVSMVDLTGQEPAKDWTI